MSDKCPKCGGKIVPCGLIYLHAETKTDCKLSNVIYRDAAACLNRRADNRLAGDPIDGTVCFGALGPFVDAANVLAHCAAGLLDDRNVMRRVAALSTAVEAYFDAADKLCMAMEAKP